MVDRSVAAGLEAETAAAGLATAAAARAKPWSGATVATVAGKQRHGKVALESCVGLWHASGRCRDPARRCLQQGSRESPRTRWGARSWKR